MKSQLFIFLFVLFFNGKAEKDGAKSLRYPKPWLEPKVHLLLKEIAQMANSSRETANTNSSDGIPAMDIQWIVDVNARRGQSSGAFGQLFPRANLLIIEPNKNHKWALMEVCARHERGNNSRCIVQWVVPGERNGGEKKAYFVSTGNQHSPGYGATDGFFRSRKKGQQRIIYKPMRKVDSVVADVVNRGTGENGTDTNGTSAPGSNRVDVVRIDLRGNTLSVLAGANTTLHQAQLLILTIGQNWAHAPSLFEVMVMTRAVGYSLVEIPTEASATLHEEAPALAGTVLTLLFVRDRSPLWGLLQLPDHRIAHGLVMTPVGPSMDPGLRAIYIQSLKDLLWSVENDVVFKEKVEKKKRAKEFRKQKLINQLIADSVKKNYDALSGKLQREMDEANVKMAPDYAAINAGRMPTPNQYPILNDSP